KSWAESLAVGLTEAVRQMEERPLLEVAFEYLIIARELYNARPDGPSKLAAAELDRRICVVLARDEFRYTPDIVDQRLEGVLGRRLPPAHPQTTVPFPPRHKDVAVAERPRPPQPIHMTTNLEHAVVPEKPAPAMVPAEVSTPVPPAQPKTTSTIMIR